jgi:recombinational DNA repair ATPase RecF
MNRGKETRRVFRFLRFQLFRFLRFVVAAYTKSASWLNMIECEFSVVARQCLNRRIPTIKQLEKEVLAIIKERNEKKIKINWQFSIESARNKLNRHYQNVFADNSKYKTT